MLKAKKANRELMIAPEKVEEYKKLGYTIVQDGKVIYTPETNSKELVAKVEKMKEASEKKDKTIAELTAKVEELTAAAGTGNDDRIAELETALAEKDKTIAELTAKVEEAAAAKKTTKASK